MSKRIFRDVALERLSTPEQLDQVMQVSRPIHWIAIIGFFTLIFIAGAWSILSGASIKVSGQGILVTQQGVLEVVTTSSGRITSFTVEEGEFVQAGQVVAQIDQPDLQAELESASLELSEIRTFQERERAIQDEYLTQRKRNVLLSIEFLNQRLTWLEERLAYEEELTKKKFIGRQRPIDTQIEINTAQEALAVANNTLNEIDLQENNPLFKDYLHICDMKDDNAIANRDTWEGRLKAVKNEIGGVEKGLNTKLDALMELMRKK